MCKAAYFNLNVLRYVHQNPVKTGLLEKLEEYPYSSYNCYMEPKLETKVRNSYINMLRREGLSVRQISRLTGVGKGIYEL